ncbi:MAG: Rqc2 family fibronectin-binding protein [Oscillospiraceae bacterium]|jgi:predicted ribosome quality control (RQC) complex YloA/Tae2 family protein
MPLDAVCLGAVVAELSREILGARIDKIYQPGGEEIVLLLRGKEGSGRLLLSGNPARPRIQMTNLALENPKTPPMFCMLLRKHLLGGRICGLVQPPMERVVDIAIEAMDEMGEYQEKHLILEAMGRHSNLILVHGDGRIADCLRRVDIEMSPKRQVLPGLYYRLPPAQEKQNPLEMTEQALAEALDRAPGEQKAADALLSSFGGLSPFLCREVAYRAGGDVDVRLCQVDRQGLLAALTQLLDQVKQGAFTPCMLLLDGQPKEFTCIRPRQYEGYLTLREESSFSALLDSFYALREARERIASKSGDLRRGAASARERAMRKVAAQKKELAEAAERDTYRVWGDLITSSLHQIKKGAPSFVTADYYQETCPDVKIPLDPLLTPQQNAARYYKRYQKAKTAAQVLTEQIRRGEADVVYLDSVLEALSKAEKEQDLQEIREELLEGGYLKRKGKPGKAKEKKPAPGQPLSFVSSAGRPILVGKNNTQNDQLTLKTAFKSDLWFHVQKRPGSHVILQCEGQPPDEGSILEAALLAAYFSSAQEGENVPVDYTQVRHVKKPKGARPGMVIYETYQTLYVTPDPALPDALGAEKRK